MRKVIEIFIKTLKILWMGVLFIFLSWAVYTAGYHTFLEQYECGNKFQPAKTKEIWV